MTIQIDFSEAFLGLPPKEFIRYRMRTGKSSEPETLTTMEARKSSGKTGYPGKSPSGI